MVCAKKKGLKLGFGFFEYFLYFYGLKFCDMDLEQHERYEYARQRIRQKKGLYFHFVLFLIGSLFVFVATHFGFMAVNDQVCIWLLTGWFFVLILHFIKVYITNRFMNKNWERAQIDRLVAKQEAKLKQLETELPHKSL